MATGTSPATTGTLAPPSRKTGEVDQFIDKQLRRTRAQVRTVDVITGLLVLAIGTLAYFLAVALVDHWLVPGGLPTAGRLAALGIYGVVAGWYFLTRVLPLLIRRINPLYAAETIERTQPSLKNSLLNFLIFRAQPQGLHENIYHAVEAQAASRLAHVPIETVVDRSRLIQIGYLLAAVLGVCALYKMLSPKDPLTSVGRVIMPWADILPPTRVSIENIDPGNSKAFRGQPVVISAEVRGLERDGKVTLLYSTTDGQIVDREVEMHLPQDGYRHTCTLPPEAGGLQQSVRYQIVAGDARSHEYRIGVVAAPTIVVDSVEYVYPDYTDLSAQRIEHQGDLKALEGTRVIVHAQANQPIKSGGIDFDCDGIEELPLTLDGSGDLARGATVTFSLQLKSDRETPTYSSYQLRFRNTDGDQNQQPIRHTIDVIADLPPEIEFLQPAQVEVRMREGDALPIELTAIDPDFALKRVRLVATVDGVPLFDKALLRSPARGQFNHKLRISSTEHNLKAGTLLEYWAVAEDVKSPEPNIVETAKRRVQIVPRDAAGQRNQDPDAQKEPPMAGEPEKPEKPNQRNQDQPADGQRDQASQGNEDAAQSQEEGGEGEQGEQGSEASPDDGQQGNGGSDSQQGERQPGDEGSETADSEAGEQGNPQDGKGEQQSGEGEQNSADQAGSEKSGAGKPQEGGADGAGESPEQAESPAANDGSEDADIFEKLQKHLQNKGDQQKSGGQDSGNQQKPGDGQTPNENPGSQASDNQNKQTPGQNGGQEKPSDKQPSADTPEGETGEGNQDRKGMEQAGPDDGARDQKKESSEGGPQGAEHAADESAEAKRGENSQAGKATDAVGEDAKEEMGEPGRDGKAEKTDQQPSGKNKPEEGREPSNSGNTRNQQGDVESDQSGKGEHAKGDDHGGTKKREDKKPEPDAKGGSEQEKGESGAGQRGSDNQGAPESQGDGRQRDKKEKPSGGPQDDENKTEAQSPSNSNRESDSKEGQSEGDRSGAGKAGGGQKADQPGTGNAGKNTASDEGAGKSEEQGHGETGEKAGNQQEADEKTGRSGSETGEGSESRPGVKPGKGEPGQAPNAPNQQTPRPQPGAEQPPSDNATPQQGTPGSGPQRGTGGEQGSNNAAPPATSGSAPGGDEANLEYARKATELVLERLRDQMDNDEIDPELLKELGWTRDDMARFLQRWEQMRAESRQEGREGERAQRELDATLRSLGLRPRGTAISGNDAADDKMRGLKQGRRSSPPAEYAEQYKAYTQGTARGNKK